MAAADLNGFEDVDKVVLLHQQPLTMGTCSDQAPACKGASSECWRCPCSGAHPVRCTIQPCQRSTGEGREVLTVQGKSRVDERVDAATGSCSTLHVWRCQLFGAGAAKVGLVKSVGKLQHRHEAVPGPPPVLVLHPRPAVFTSVGWALVIGRRAWKALSDTRCLTLMCQGVCSDQPAAD